MAVISGLLISLDPGAVCHLDSDNLPKTIWNYPALCFVFWAYSVPVGLILAATGILMRSEAVQSTAWPFLAGTLGVFVFISFANGPMPHVPQLFGVGGALILLFYFMILWTNASRLKDNWLKLTGYTFLVIGLWFTCGLGSRQYQPLLGAGESPIDIMAYFVLAMLFFWLGEKRARRSDKI